jgi:hypothetical protein
LEAVASFGLLPIQWDVSSGDAMPGLTGEKMAAEVQRRVRPGSIVLFHANGRGRHTAEALRILIPAMRAQGYQFATVTELLETRGATYKQEPICYDTKPGDVNRHDKLARKLDQAHQRFYARFAPKRLQAPATSLPVSAPPQPAAPAAPPAPAP